MMVISASNPVKTKHGVELLVDFEGIGLVPFHATPDDSEDHGRDLYARAMAGEFGTVAPIPEPSLAEVKSAKLAQIERDRDTQRYANVSAWGRNWQADQTSQDLLNGAINLAGHGVPLPAVWRDADNADMPVTTLSDLVTIAYAMAAATQTAYATSWARKAAVEAATTVAGVEAV